MVLPTRISAVTLACRDIARMAAFYRQFGWPEAATSVPEHVVFQCTNGIVLGLFAESRFDEEFGRVSGGFRGFTLTIHVEDEAAVFEAHGVISEFDDLTELGEPHRSGWGCGFSFQDPEENVWDIAFKHGAEFDHHGGFVYP